MATLQSLESSSRVLSFQRAGRTHRIGILMRSALLWCYPGRSISVAATNGMTASWWLIPPAHSTRNPPQAPHFSWAKDGEVIIQITGVGPSGKTFIALISRVTTLFAALHESAHGRY